MPVASSHAGLSSTTALGSCTLLVAIFVGSFYLFPGATSKSRNDPVVIVQRFKAVGATCGVGFVLLVGLLALARNTHYFPTEAPTQPFTVEMRMHILWGWIWTALEHAGFISPAPITSVAVSLILCVTLFLGPLIMEGAEIYALVQQTISQPDDHLMAIRAWIVGPIVEEVVFRGYMVPLMIAGGFSVHQIIWYLPLFFGVAHLHHAWETIRDHGYTRSAVLKAITLSGFQLIYTSIFGWLATYLFIRTGSIYCPLSAHVFCNIMGFPDLGRLVDGTLFQQGRNVEAMCEVVMMIE